MALLAPALPGSLGPSLVLTLGTKLNLLVTRVPRERSSEALQRQAWAAVLVWGGSAPLTSLKHWNSPESTLS